MTDATAPDAPLVTLAHGSRDPRFAETVEQVMTEVRRLRPAVTAAAAHLELSEPDLNTVCAQLPERRAVVVPLLFARAFHARIDVPRTLREATEATGVELGLAGIVGLDDDVTDLLDHTAAAAGIAGNGDVVLVAVGSSNARANEEVQALARRWSIRRGGRVDVAFATCEPRAAGVLTAARADGRHPGLVPLFLAPGLLLDQVLALPDAADLTVADPLGALVAPLVLARYDAAVDARPGGAAVPDQNAV